MWNFHNRVRGMWVIIPGSMAVSAICNQACICCMFGCSIVASAWRWFDGDTNNTSVCLYKDFKGCWAADDNLISYEFLPHPFMNFPLLCRTDLWSKGGYVFWWQTSTLNFLLRNQGRYSWVFAPSASFNNWQDVVCHLHKHLIPDSLQQAAFNHGWQLIIHVSALMDHWLFFYLLPHPFSFCLFFLFFFSDFCFLSWY